jgi:hypothetical protein
MMSESVGIYNLLNRGNSKFFNQTPDLYYPKLSDTEYTEGYFTRYFIRTANDQHATITEIDQTEFNIFISNPFYTGISVKWKITGALNDVVIDDILHELSVGNYNYSQLKLANGAFPGILNKLTDLHQFYKAS